MSIPAETEAAEILSVPVDDIEIPAFFRKTNRKKVGELADSIEREGLLQPVGVRRSPEGNRKPFQLVFGGHRHAAHRKLKRKDILARLLDLDDLQAESAMLAENLFRAPLKLAAYLAALLRWNDLYREANPDVHGKGHPSLSAARPAAEGVSGFNPLTSAEGDDAEHGAADRETVAAPETFRKKAAAVMGVGPSKIEKDVRLAKKFSPDELSALAQRGVPDAEIRKLGQLPDDQRPKVVALIAAGMERGAAVAAVTAPANATVERVIALDAPGYKPEPEMTDAEWLAVYCCDALSRLKTTETYKKDAVLWRQTRDPRRAFRSATRKAVVQARGGNYAYRLLSLDVAHPNEWPACGPCGGSGTDTNGLACGQCRGHAFALKKGA